MFNYIFFTWFLANLLHPLMWIFWAMAMGGGSAWSDGAGWWLFFMTILCLIISLPCLLVGYILLKAIGRTPLTVQARFCLWLIASPGLAFLESMLIIGLLFRFFGPGDLVFVIPALVATALSTLLRYSQFTKLFETPKTDANEQSLY